MKLFASIVTMAAAAVVLATSVHADTPVVQDKVLDAATAAEVPTSSRLIAADSEFFTDSFIGQVHVKSLLVKPGGWVQVILDFLVTDWPFDSSDDGVDTRKAQARQLDDGDTVPPPTDLVISCVIPYSSDGDKVEFKSATLRPNTWGKGKADVDVIAAGAQVTLLDDDVVTDKQYKATWKFYVGKDIASGTEIPFRVDVLGTDWSEEVVVTVK